MFTSKKYKFSERINQLAEPRSRYVVGKQELINKELFHLNNMMVTYKEISPRTIDLAKPRKVEKNEPMELRRIPSRVLNAVGEKTTLRFLDFLASNGYFFVHDVSATERTIQLSKPRLTPKTKEPRRKSISSKNCQAMVSRLMDPPRRYGSRQDHADRVRRESVGGFAEKKPRRKFPVATLTKSDTSITEVRKHLTASFELHRKKMLECEAQKKLSTHRR